MRCLADSLSNVYSPVNWTLGRLDTDPPLEVSVAFRLQSCAPGPPAPLFILLLPRPSPPPRYWPKRAVEDRERTESVRSVGSPKCSTLTSSPAPVSCAEQRGGTWLPRVAVPYIIKRDSFSRLERAAVGRACHKDDTYPPTYHDPNQLSARPDCQARREIIPPCLSQIAGANSLSERVCTIRCD